MARRRHRRRNPQSNTLLYVLGGAAVLGVGYLLLNKSSTPTALPAAGTTPGSITINSGTPANNSWLGQLGAGFHSLFPGSNNSGNSSSSGSSDISPDPGYIDPTAGDPTATDSNTIDFVDTTSTGV